LYDNIQYPAGRSIATALHHAAPHRTAPHRENDRMTDTATATELTEQEAADFRQRCVDFLEEHATGGRGRGAINSSKEFLAAAADAGLGGIPYPSEYGGGGLTLAHDKIWREVKANYQQMEFDFIISHGMCLPMLNEYGTHEQKTEFLADNIAGRTMWCQMFSEPSSGSDVASLQTKAELDGDQWVINGQKVWTTLAHVSDYGLLVARTDPEQPKHAGISMFIIDMKAPGVEIRPIHQIDGGTHFNEVFFTDVHIPKDWLVGDYNAGWKMATAMLMYERVAIGSAGAGKIDHPIYGTLLAAAKASGKLGDPVVRDEMMKIYAMETTKSLIAMRTRAEMKSGKTPGPGGSLGKLYGAIIARKMREVALEIAGPGSVAWAPGDSDELQRVVLNSFSSNIAGGTDEIQRNIIGDRVLGLPREPSVDKGVPFKDLKVGTQKS
jgi:alkylation response protein AidB-like acyl-CoA dehydrogenase